MLSPPAVIQAVAPAVLADAQAPPASSAAGPPPAASPPAVSTQPAGEPPAARAKAGQDAAGTEFPPEGTGGTWRVAGRYFISRWAEDWSFLRDPAKRTDPFDPLKYIPLDDEGSTYLTLVGNARFGFYSNDNPGLSRTAQAENAFLHREIFGADLHLGPNVRFYGELANAGVDGDGYRTIIATQRSEAFVQQAFVELRGQAAGADLGTMIGRQEFTDGPIQIFSTRDVPNLHFEFDGERFYANWSRLRIDAFSFNSVKYSTGDWQTSINQDERIQGLNTSLVVRPTPTVKLFFDPFYYRYSNNLRRWGTTTGRDDLNIYGARLWGQALGFNMDWTYERQTGTYINRDVSAFAVYTSTTHVVPGAPWRLTLGFHADAASGGGAYGKGTLHDADWLFAKSPYLSDGSLFSGQNLVVFAPNVSVTPVKPLALSVEYEQLWRYSQDDAVYAASKLAYAGTQAVAGRHIGDLLRLKAIWTVNPHVSISPTVEYLTRGVVLERAHLGDALFTATYVNLRF